MKNVSEDFKTHVMNASKIVNSKLEQIIFKNRPPSSYSIESNYIQNIVYNMFHVLIKICYQILNRSKYTYHIH